MREPTQTFELIELLCRHQVEFIVLGMTSAVLQGTPALTFDLDIVYARDDDNVTRLLVVLGELGALFRNDPRKIAPNRAFERPVPMAGSTITLRTAERCRRVRSSGR
jgi:hypothetical protein